MNPAVLKGDKDDEDKVRGFLESLGVLQVEEKHLISSFLMKYYHKDSKEQVTLDAHLEHVQQLVRFWEKDPTYPKMLQEYSFLLGVAPAGRFFNCDSRNSYIIGDETARQRILAQPKMLYIDAPYDDTKLNEFFAVYNTTSVGMKYSLAGVYDGIKGFTEFVLALGVFNQLGIESIEATVAQPEIFPKIGRRTQTTIDVDYYINGFYLAIFVLRLS